MRSHVRSRCAALIRGFTLVILFVSAAPVVAQPLQVAALRRDLHPADRGRSDFIGPAPQAQTRMDAYAEAFGFSHEDLNGPNYAEGSLWSESSRFNTPFAPLPPPVFEIGDIIVVEISENVTSQEDISVEHETDGSLTFGITKLWQTKVDRYLFGSDGGSIDYPGTSMSGTDNYEGEATGQRTSRLRLEIACTVKRILPDGRLLIEGRASRVIGRDKKLRVLTGLVRPEDVDADTRTVDSTRVAESQMRLEGQGPGENVAKPGLVNTLLDWIPIF